MVTSDTIKPQALVVDDDDAMLDLYRALLQRDGFEVTTHISGETASRELESRRYDLIVLDLNLPGMSGRDLLHSIRNSSLNMRSPVLVVSVRYGVDDSLTCQALGANGFLAKPFKVRELRDAFSQVREDARSVPTARLMPMLKSQDRRHEARYEARGSNTLHFERNGVLREMKGQFVNASCGGVCINTAEALPIGTEVYLDSILLAALVPMPRYRVTWCRSSEQAFTCGLQLLSPLDEHKRNALSAFLDGYRCRHLPLPPLKIRK